MNYMIDRDDIGEYCEACHQPIYVNERVIEIVLAGKWFDGHQTVGQLIHFACVSTNSPVAGDENE